MCEKVLFHRIMARYFSRLRAVLICLVICCSNEFQKNDIGVLICRSDGSSAKIHYMVKDCSGNQRPDQDLPVSVNAFGLLTSAAFTGQACLLLTSHEDFAVNQSIVVLVKVSVTQRSRQ
jgi:hypothetical protein